jgi:hypothetical protein
MTAAASYVFWGGVNVLLAIVLAVSFPPPMPPLWTIQLGLAVVFFGLAFVTRGRE